jgi:hypothetical protein
MSTQECSNSGEKLVDGERFYQVIVRAGVKSSDSISDLMASGEQENRCAYPSVA